METNPGLKEANGIFRDETALPFVYTDGEQTENYIFDVIHHAKDVSIYSPELESKIADWGTEYHLTSKRANLLKFLDLSNIETGLELGCGMGSMTRYLGESGICVDAIEGSRSRAEIAGERCRDLENVNIIHSDFNGLDLPEASYDAVFLIGVLEYARKYMPHFENDRDAVLSIIGKARFVLKKGGILVIAIENRMGLKYIMGATEDHYGEPYIGLYGYPQNQGVRTYDKREWEEMLHGAGIGHFGFGYPFPDYKLPKVILSGNYLKNDPYASSNLYRVYSRDYLQDAWKPKVEEFLTWKSLHATGHLEEFSNSFLIVCADSGDVIKKAFPYDFVHYSDTVRKAEFRTETSKPADKDCILKKLNVIESIPAIKDGKEVLQQDLSVSPYIKGELLSTLWLQSATGASDISEFSESIISYYHFLTAYLSKDENRGEIDVLPFNIIIDENGDSHIIDREWRFEDDITPDFVMFRALFWFAFSNKRSLENICSLEGIRNIKDFIAFGFERLSLDLEANLSGYLEREQRFQSATVSQKNPEPIHTKLLEPIHEIPLTLAYQKISTQFYWASGEGRFSEEKSMIQTVDIEPFRQKVSFRIPSEDYLIYFLRFDPASNPGFFMLHEIAIRKVTGDQSECLWSLKSAVDIRNYVNTEQIYISDTVQGEIFISDNFDPYISFKIPESIDVNDGKGTYYFDVKIEWPQWPYDLVVEKALKKRNTLLEERVSRNELELTRLNERAARAEQDFIRTDNELKRLYGSLSFRVLEKMRFLVYEKLLGKLPFARKTVSFVLGGNMKRIPDVAKKYLQVRKEMLTFSTRPKISLIMPVYNVDAVFLKDAINSVCRQSYKNWELCIAEDASTEPHVKDILNHFSKKYKNIKVTFLEENQGISGASNEAVRMAEGDYLAFLDHDDEITWNALFEVVKKINSHHPDVVYSDEEIISEEGHCLACHHKPDYSPDLLLCHNYITHFLSVKRELFHQVGGFSKEFDGAQDYDLILKLTENAEKIVHIPEVLYRWRSVKDSTSFNPEAKSYADLAGRKALSSALERRRIKGRVEKAEKKLFYYRVKRELQKEPLVSIIIPFKDKPDLLQKCMNAILKKSSYTNYEIIGVSNNSKSDDTFHTMRALEKRDPRIRFIELNIPFNYSKINNHAVEEAGGEHIVLMNNDIEVVNNDWLEALLEHSQREDVGAVGAKLYYPDNTIQHAGVVIGIAGFAGHSHRHYKHTEPGHFNRLNCIQNISAVTGALLMVKKSLYLSLGGLNEEAYSVALNDVDFCLRLMEKGYHNIFTPFCEAYHYESVSRGYEDTPERKERFEGEIAHFRKRWKSFLDAGDPYYNKNLTLEKEDFSIAT